MGEIAKCQIYGLSDEEARMYFCRAREYFGILSPEMTFDAVAEPNVGASPAPRSAIIDCLDATRALMVSRFGNFNVAYDPSSPSGLRLVVPEGNNARPCLEAAMIILEGEIIKEKMSLEGSCQ